MKTLKLVSLLIVLLAAAVSSATDMGTSHGFDLDALWAQAQRTYDTQNLDAVVLLEDREVTLEPSGDLATTVHRVVWINSAVAIRAYADLRVPWNQANSRLEVEVLRTWRDGRWWPDASRISETAVVPTLPYAVDHADDYTALRETMLLHDGIELPCILETRYTITRHGAPAAQGTFVFPQRDPAVRARLAVTVPADIPLRTAAMPGAPRPVENTSAGAHTTVWDMETPGQLGLPVAAEPAAYEPAVVFSTWKDWETVGAVFSAAFDAAAHIGPALADSVATRTEHLADPLDQVQAVLDFVEESTRNIHSDWRLWDVPRSADRTWETAYGNAWDRVALAAGAIRSLAVVSGGSDRASLSADPLFLGRGTVAVAPEVPRIDDDWDLVLDLGVLHGERVFWTPDGALHGAEEIMIRPLFVPSLGTPVFMTKPGVDNLVRCDVTVTPDPDEGWTWSGTVTADGLFSFHGAVLAGEDLSRAAGKVLGELLPEIDLDSCNPRVFTQQSVTTSCTGEVSEPGETTSGEMALIVGDPGDGVFTHLPRDIHLYDSGRSSAFLVPAMAQEITLRMPLKGFDAVRLPRAMTVENAAGRFMVSAKVADGWLVYRRKVRVTGEGSWPELRAILLEAQDDAHRNLILKAGGAS